MAFIWIAYIWEWDSVHLSKPSRSYQCANLTMYYVWLKKKKIIADHLQTRKMFEMKEKMCEVSANLWKCKWIWYHMNFITRDRSSILFKLNYFIATWDVDIIAWAWKDLLKENQCKVINKSEHKKSTKNDANGRSVSQANGRGCWHRCFSYGTSLTVVFALNRN